MMTASAMLLHSLATWPRAGVAHVEDVPAHGLQRGARELERLAGPPTMKVSVPAAAPAVPPETGASIMRMPRSSAACATFCAEAGAMVLQSITSAGRQLREHAGIAQVERLDMPARGQHRDHGAGATTASATEAATSTPLLARDLAGLCAEVEGLDRVAGLDQVGGHRAAHAAQADEGDMLTHACLLL